MQTKENFKYPNCTCGKNLINVLSFENSTRLWALRQCIWICCKTISDRKTNSVLPNIITITNRCSPLHHPDNPECLHQQKTEAVFRHTGGVGQDITKLVWPVHYYRYDTRTMGALLFTIVFVQLVCHLPRTGLNIYEIYMVRPRTLLYTFHSCSVFGIWIKHFHMSNNYKHFRLW